VAALPDDRDALIAEVIRREAERGERLVSTLRALMHTSAMVSAAIILRLLELPPMWRTLKTVLLVMAPFVIAATWGWVWWVTRHAYKPLYGFISVTGDVLTLAAGMACASIWLGDAAAEVNALGATPPLLGLFFVVASAGLRQDARLCVWAGVLGIVSFAVAVAVAHRSLAAAFTDPDVGFFAGPAMWAGRALILGFATALAAVTARNARRMALTAATELADRTALVRTFGRFVDPEIARDAMATDSRPETREVSVLFTDLRGFTSLTEKLSPSELLTTLDAYYGALVPSVYVEGGIVNKFIGDAIMATFGAPAPQADHAERATAAARGMVRSIAALNEERAKSGGAPLVIGVGIATGPVALGRLGPANRVEYGVIGDTVNLAARLESMNKEHGTTILCDAATANAIGAGTRRLGDLPVRGKAAPVPVFSISV
jgi:adenylate cyclase